MKTSILTSLTVTWERKKLFLFCSIGIAAIICLDLFTIVSFQKLPHNIESLVGLENGYHIFEEWYAYTGYFFSICFYILLLGCMSVIFLVNAWEGKIKLIPILLVWHSSLGIISFFGKLGFLFRASGTHMFSGVADALGELSFLPLLLCFAYYMERTGKYFVSLILVNCLCSASYLLALVWQDSEVGISVTQVLSNISFLICFLASIVFSILEFKDKNISYRAYPQILLFSILFVLFFQLFTLFVKTAGFSVSQIRMYGEELIGDFNLFRSQWLEAVFFVCVSLLMLFNYLRQYHQHTLQVKTLRLRDEANLEYARNLQKYEMKVREIKHDMSNTLNVAGMLCKNGEYDHLSEYLSAMTDHIASVRTGRYCSHILVNYLLLMFEERFIKVGADFRCEASLPAKLEILDNDLASELNNILQNALDAVLKLPEEERWVEFVVRMEKSVVRIDCRNPYDGKPIKNTNGLLQTSKADRRAHGLGLSIIYEIAEKYDGVAVPLFGDGIFELKVAIPNGKTE